MATSPPRSPNSGDRPETADLALAAPAQPTRIWNSLVARLPTLPNSLLLVAASDLLRRLLAVRRRRRRRRRPSLPLPIYDDAASSARWEPLLESARRLWFQCRAGFCWSSAVLCALVDCWQNGVDLCGFSVTGYEMTCDELVETCSGIGHSTQNIGPTTTLELTHHRSGHLAICPVFLVCEELPGMLLTICY